ncbi:TPR repeat-containing thioredoxin TTL1 [Selaginella moellendorffii]|nr:TPR repeat-containing thioredoxin TTL1 [Selaginella moellendorffii]|eukprot:XP_002966637.2 TPR repeat-containing thioredoxin TTL1 [Selaginella moellendorffii]
MSHAQADGKKLGGSSEALDPFAKLKPQANGATRATFSGEAVPDSSSRLASTNFFFGAPRLSSSNNAGNNPGRSGVAKHGSLDAAKSEDSAVLNLASDSFTFKHDTESLDAFKSRGAFPTGNVVEGLPLQKRSGELPRGSSSSSGDSPMFDMSRPARKSGELSRVSISSGASFSGEIPRASLSSSGEIADGFRSQRRVGEVPRGSNSSGSSSGESPTVEGHRGTANRKSGEIYHGNSSGGSSSGGSPTPEIFNRGRKNGEGGAHGSNSSAGSSDGGSPTAESLWGGKGGPVLNTGMVTGGSFSTFNAVANGGGSTTAMDNGSIKKEKPGGILKTQNGGESNGTRLNANPAPTSSRFLVGAASPAELRTGIKLTGTTNTSAYKKVSYVDGGRAGESQGIRNIVPGGESKSNVSAEDVKNSGNAEYKKGNFAKALSLYDRAISLCPDQAAYRCNRAAALAGLNRVGEAVQESEMALKLDSSFSRAHQRLVSLLLRLGQTEQARKHLKGSGQQNETGDSQRITLIERRLTNCFEAKKLKDWNAVLRECDAAIVAGADYSLQVYVLKAESLLKLQRLDEADAALAAARRVEDASPRSTKVEFSNNLVVLLAQADMAQGRFEEAVAITERAARLDPQNFEVSSLLRKARTVSKARAAGNDFFKAAKFFEACAAYTEGLELDPANAILLCNRAASRSKLGQWEKTLEDCNAALQVQPKYMKALLRRAHSYAKLERWEDAARDYEAIRREHPGDVEVAQALFDVQVALKKSRGEEISRTHFGGGVEEVFRNDQFREAISCPGLSVVEFTTRWSDRCRQFSTFVEELCRRYPSVNFSKVDVDDSPYLAQLESISSVPTFKIFRNGVNVKELLGPSQQGLEQAVKQCGGV